MKKKALDFIGVWSEEKLNIIKEYCAAYSNILKAQNRFDFYYIDAFAGAGMHISKRDSKYIKGSPINALSISPKFDKYYFIDKSDAKINALKHHAKLELQNFQNEMPNVEFINDDCNKILINDLFPKIKFKEYKRALCILDPYGLHLDWDVLQAAGDLGTIDIFLNFPLMDINMNVLHHDLKTVKPEQRARMDRFWGDDSWLKDAYTTEQDFICSGCI